MKKHMRQADGMYHIKVDGKIHKFPELEGSRAKVWHGTAYKTAGGLTKKGLLKNKWGDIVSREMSKTAKKERRLEKHGYTTKKGKFGAVKIAKKTRKARKSRKSKKGGKRHY